MLCFFYNPLFRRRSCVVYLWYYTTHIRFKLSKTGDNYNTDLTLSICDCLADRDSVKKMNYL